MRNRKFYPPWWRQMALAVKEKAGWKCQKCGVAQGTLRYSVWSDREWPVYLQAAHINHDPENLNPELVAVCPFCHWHHFRKPGTRPSGMIEQLKHRQLLAKRGLFDACKTA